MDTTLSRLAFATVLLLAAPDAAHAEFCTPVESGLDDFGIAPLGNTSLTRMDRLATIMDGSNFEGNGVLNYRDRRGIFYAVDALSETAGVLDEKSITVADWRGPLPFGLRRSMGPDAAAAHFQRRYGIALKPDLQVEDVIRLSSGLCLRNANGTFAIRLEFQPTDRLSVIEITDHTW